MHMGLTVYVMNGRFGAYVQLGETPERPAGKAKGKGKAAAPVEKPKRASLQAGMTESTVTLEEALKLLSLPRLVGPHPDDGEPIVTNFGRFGPYVKHNDEFRSLESEEDVFSIAFDAALALLRAPKQGRRRAAAQKKVLHELSENGTTLKVLAGRYGPYVTDGTTNASIPKSTAPEQLTFAQATELLAARRDAPPSPRRGGGRRRAAAAVGATKTADKAAGKTKRSARKSAGA
jgi:DNA topoisomerase-1